jgi:uncharacterized protein
MKMENLTENEKIEITGGFGLWDLLIGYYEHGGAVVKGEEGGGDAGGFGGFGGGATGGGGAGGSW